MIIFKQLYNCSAHQISPVLFQINISCSTYSQAKEAMKHYWDSSKDEKNKEGHFVRRSENIVSYCVSEAVDNVVKQVPKAPFLM